MDGSDFDFYLCSCCPSGKGDMDVPGPQEPGVLEAQAAAAPHSHSHGRE